MAAKTVLIVDDSDVIRRVIKQMLWAFKLDTREAAGGIEALEYCCRQMPDAIILDWLMPDSSGFETLMALRKLPGGDAPLVFYCTTENNLRSARIAIAAGADEILVKPFDRVLLRQRLERTGLLAAPPAGIAIASPQVLPQSVDHAATPA